MNVKAKLALWYLFLSLKRGEGCLADGDAFHFVLGGGVVFLAFDKLSKFTLGQLREVYLYKAVLLVYGFQELPIGHVEL